MTPPSSKEIAQAVRWLGEAEEELAVAVHVFTADDLPDRVACFHAHLAAEKALKSLQIRRGILVRKVHNLREIVQELPEGDRQLFDPEDLDLLNPWTIGGRYPADLEEVDGEVTRSIVAAVDRVLSAVREASGNSELTKD